MRQAILCLVASALGLAVAQNPTPSPAPPATPTDAGMYITTPDGFTGKKGPA